MTHSLQRNKTPDVRLRGLRSNTRCKTYTSSAKAWCTCCSNQFLLQHCKSLPGQNCTCARHAPAVGIMIYSKQAAEHLTGMLSSTSVSKGLHNIGSSSKQRGVVGHAPTGCATALLMAVCAHVATSVKEEMPEVAASCTNWIVYGF